MDQDKMMELEDSELDEVSGGWQDGDKIKREPRR